MAPVGRSVSVVAAIVAPDAHAGTAVHPRGRSHDHGRPHHHHWGGGATTTGGGETGPPMPPETRTPAAADLGRARAARPTRRAAPRGAYALWCVAWLGACCRVFAEAH